MNASRDKRKYHALLSLVNILFNPMKIEKISPLYLKD